MKSSGDLRPEHRRTARLLDMRIPRRSDAALWSVEKHPMLRPNLAAAVSFDRSFGHDRLSRARLSRSHRGSFLSCGGWPSTHCRWPRGGRFDPNFDVGSHLRFIGAPGDGTSAAVLRFLKTFVMDPFDASRPPVGDRRRGGHGRRPDGGSPRDQSCHRRWRGVVAPVDAAVRWKPPTCHRQKGILRPGDGEGGANGGRPRAPVAPRMTDVAPPRRPRPDAVARRDDGPRGGDGPFIRLGCSSRGADASAR